jgi:AraC-like DNA-binding protein
MISNINSKLPVVNLNFCQISSESRFQAWHEMAFPLFDTLPIKNPKTYSGSITTYQVNHLVFTEVSFDIQQFRRTDHHLSQDGSDFLLLQFYQTGQQRGYLDDGSVLINGPGIISLQDFAHSYSAVGQAGKNYGVLIPRHLIQAHDQIYRHHPFISWSVNSPQGRILLSILDAIWQELPHATQADASALTSGLVGLLNGILTPKLDAETCLQVKQATFKAMKNYLITNLDDVNLGIRQLCEKFHCSRATVYRLFAATGGVQTFLREQRLNHSYQQLQKSSTNPTATISQIASQCGFFDVAHFSRLFKKHYGIPPSNLLKRQPIDSPTIQTLETKSDFATNMIEIKRFHNWMSSCNLLNKTGK